ncbi:hypothetical protein CKO15_03420 [Halorhodospira abdelmalekii]|uniref:DciA family protein n=1 Tax=Halorhodospira abdelmalekii TaxID=421629 RepID=UPI001F5BFA74|nr:DciA family protein [Halorhodospira abdelmalekii]MBK1734348.1 hypothetical protein [Halorhodospira abdelmalekii]
MVHRGRNHDAQREGRLRRLAPHLAVHPGPLKALIDHTRVLEQLRRRLQPWLPEELRGEWHLARLDADEMVLVASSSAWAMRLRYLSRTLQEAAEKIGGTRPQRVSIRIAPNPAQRSRLQPPGPLSDRASAVLRSAAATTDDPRLREALARLASRRRLTDSGH